MPPVTSFHFCLYHALSIMLPPPGAATVIRSDADLRNARRKWCSVASTSAIYLGGPLLLTRCSVQDGDR
jgi:hypothetical protein